MNGILQDLLAACEAMLPLHESYQADIESPSFKGSRTFVAENARRLESIKAAIAKAKTPTAAEAEAK